METQNEIDYQRIADAIEFLRLNYKHRPSLDEVAEHVHLSPFHFQRMFKQWAGVTPKQFLQYVSVEHAKQILKEQKASLINTAFETGLSGTGRLHDLFIKVEGMTPGEYKNGGEQLAINYSFSESLFGLLLIASTAKGICYTAFADDGKEKALADLMGRFPKAVYINQQDAFQLSAISIFAGNWSSLSEIKLHLKGTSFQIKVWEALLKIPMGALSTYSGIAANLNSPNASRAVGSAIGSNPIAFLIPCHRVIKSTGEIGQYHWGNKRKNAMIGREASQAF